mgnify:CR=1 FL=1
MTWEEYERRVALTALATDCVCFRPMRVYMMR